MSTALRVLHITKATGIGGSEHHLVALLGALDRTRFASRLLVLEDPARPPVAYLAKLVRTEIPHAVIPIHGHLDPTLLPRLVARIREWKPDIVHTHLLHADLFGIPAARLAGVRAVVSTKHNDDPFRRGLIGKVDRALSGLVDRVIVISDHLRRFYRDIEGIPTEKLTRIHYGLDADGAPADGATVRQEFGLGPDAPLAGVVARLEEQKGHRYLLDAFARVRAAVPGARLLLVGLGPLRPALERQAADLALGDAVIFAGFREDVDRIMAALDLFVLPSLWEGFGLVLLEAMRAAKPVVATTVSAIPEIVVNGQTGVLVEPRDAAALAEALLRLFYDPGVRAAMGAAGRGRLERAFSIEAMVDATAEIYLTIASARRR